jgi:hypothetical protein
MTPKPWSYTALTSFETCPRRHYLTRATKTVKEPEGEALVWGRRVHEALEHRLQLHKPLPAELKQYEPIVAKLLDKPAVRFVEEQIALTKEFDRTPWFSKEVWVRGAFDLALQYADNPAYDMLIIDWKTGKVKPDSDQLKLFAALAFTVYPQVNTVKTAFVWLKDSKITPEMFTRDQSSEIWAEFSARVARLDNAYTTGKWPAKPSGLCRRWCPVGKRHCEFCGD